MDVLDVVTTADLKRKVKENATVLALLYKQNRILKAELTEQSILNGVRANANTERKHHTIADVHDALHTLSVRGEGRGEISRCQVGF